MRLERIRQWLAGQGTRRPVFRLDFAYRNLTSDSRSEQRVCVVKDVIAFCKGRKDKFVSRDEPRRSPLINVEFSSSYLSEEAEGSKPDSLYRSASLFLPPLLLRLLPAMSDTMIAEPSEAMTTVAERNVPICEAYIGHPNRIIPLQKPPAEFGVPCGNRVAAAVIAHVVAAVVLPGSV